MKTNQSPFHELWKPAETIEPFFVKYSRKIVEFSLLFQN